VPGGALPLPGSTPSIDHTYKLFIGGKQARPDAPYMRIIKGAKGQVSRLALHFAHDVECDTHTHTRARARKHANRVIVCSFASFSTTCS
jgi:hypothetical protein